MRVSVVAATIGMAAGAGATLMLAGPDADNVAAVSHSAPYAVTTINAALPDVASLVQAGNGIEQRAEYYDAVLDAELPALALILSDVIRLPQSPQRLSLLSVLVSRMAEQDSLETLDLLSREILDPRTARELGLLLLDSLTLDAESVHAVLEALPQIDAQRFRAEALWRLAASSPELAIVAALEFLDQGHGTSSLRATVRVWVEHSPLAALEFADSIADSRARNSYTSAVLRELATVDRSAMLSYLDENYGDSPGQRDTLIQTIARGIARKDPAFAMELAERLPFESRMRVDTTVGAWLARLDPAAAMAYAEDLPQGGYQYMRLKSVLGTWSAEVAPDAALDWIRSLDPFREDLAEAVLEGVARVDPIRAINAGEELSVAGSLRDVDSIRISAPDIAERVLAVQDPEQRAEWLRTLLQSWSNADRDAAIGWVVANSGSVDPGGYETIAQGLGWRDLNAAFDYVGQLPADVRDSWVSTAVENYGRQSPAAAVDWIAQYRGQPVYDAAAASILEAATRENPGAAASLFPTLSSVRQAEVARQLGRSWGYYDPPAARDWVVAMPVGTLRDTALAGVVEAYRETPPDDAILALFDSDSLRQEVLVDVVSRLGERDAEAGRDLIERYLTNPALRQQAEYLLASGTH